MQLAVRSLPSLAGSKVFPRFQHTLFGSEQQVLLAELHAQCWHLCPGSPYNGVVSQVLLVFGDVRANEPRTIPSQYQDLLVQYLL